MKLLVTTPVSVAVDADEVHHVRAEDETGAFGILPGHADFITILSVSVITWRDRLGEDRHIAVRGGVLSVRGGGLVEVATREAVGEDTLRQLGESVLQRFRAEVDAEEGSRLTATRLHLAAIRQLQRYLESGRRPLPQGLPPTLSAAMARDGSPPESGMR